MALFWGASPFDELIDKATSELLPAGSSDIALNLEICDQIRSKSVTPQVAMRSIKRRVDHKNPNVQLLALELADTCTKNGGDQFLLQVASREFMDDLVSIVKSSSVNRDVKATILRLIQSWSRGMEGKAECAYVGETYKTLKSSGFEFPPLSPAATTATLFQTATAPTWTDSDRCMRCRELFTFTFRKHHCRNCGQTFCQGCSSYTARLDHFGINQDVRVCKPCYEKLTRKNAGDKADGAKKDVVGSHGWVRKERERSDKDLERAIALSLAEAKSNGYALDEPATVRPPQLAKGLPKDIVEEENDPELLAAIRASLEDMASAPSPVPDGPAPSDYFPAPPPPLPSYDLSLPETTAIIDFSEAVESGRPVRELDGLRERVDLLRPKLVRALDDTERKEQVLTDMHSKLAEVVKLFDHHLNAQLERRSSAYHQTQRTSSYASYAPQRAMTSPAPAQQSYAPDYAQRPQGYGVAPTPYAPEQYSAARQPYAAPPVAEPQQAYNAQPMQQYAPSQRQEPYVSQPPRSYQAPVSQQQTQPQPTYNPPQPEYAPPAAQTTYPRSPVQIQATGSTLAQPVSPTIQFSSPPAHVITAPPVSYAIPPTAHPAQAVQQQVTHPPQTQGSAPAAPSRQSSYAAPPVSTSRPFGEPERLSMDTQRQAAPQYPFEQHRQPAQAAPTQAPSNNIPAFPAAPQNVFPSAFPVAPTEIPSTFERYTPAREEKEVPLIEL